MSSSAAPRAVAVVGHAGAGKTALVAALGGPVTPSGLQLVEGRAAVALADAVLFVLSSAQGLDPTLPLRWEEAADAGLPRLVAVTQLDLPRADHDESVAVLQRVLGEGVHPVALPVLDDDERVAGVLRLLDLALVVGDDVRPADPEHAALVEGLRDDLVEAVLAGGADDALFDAWLDGTEPPAGVLHEELLAGVRSGALHPVVPVTPEGAGAATLLDLLAGLPAVAPAPVHDPDGGVVEPAGDPHGPLVARVVDGGLLRVLSGTLRSGPVLVDGGPAQARPVGLDGAPRDAVRPGEVACSPGLPAGLLSAPDRPLTD